MPPPPHLTGFGVCEFIASVSQDVHTARAIFFKPVAQDTPELKSHVSFMHVHHVMSVRVLTQARVKDPIHHYPHSKEACFNTSVQASLQ